MKRKKVAFTILATLIVARFLFFPVMYPGRTQAEPEEPANTLNLNRQVLYLEYGEFRCLSIIGQSQAPQWSSSDPTIATVNQDGQVFAAGPGTALITVRDGREFTTCQVNVSLTITLCPEQIWLRPGETCQVVAQPGESAVWGIFDPKIAQVDSQGLVTALSPGKTEVTVTVAGATVMLPVCVYEKTVTKDELFATIKVPLPAKPSLALLENSEELLEWLIALDKWQGKMYDCECPGELCSKEALEAISELSLQYYCRPLWPYDCGTEEILLPEGVFYEWTPSGGYYSPPFSIVCSYSDVVDVTVVGQQIIIKADFNAELDKYGPGRYVFIYGFIELGDSFRIDSVIFTYDIEGS